MCIGVRNVWMRANERSELAFTKRLQNDIHPLSHDTSPHGHPHISLDNTRSHLSTTSRRIHLHLTNAQSTLVHLLSTSQSHCSHTHPPLIHLVIDWLAHTIYPHSSQVPHYFITGTSLSLNVHPYTPKGTSSQFARISQPLNSQPICTLNHAYNVPGYRK